MVFSSLTFLIYFLPLHLVLYFLLRTRKQRNILLIISSLLFYAWGEPVWISLMLFSAGVDFYCGKRIQRSNNPSTRRIGLVISLISNLSLLGFFKYGGLFIGTLNQLFSLNLPFYTFGLPIGISFYTFQTLSYTIDVYRGEAEANEHFLDFLLFVSLFHQLVAGPIVRYRDIAHEIRHREENWHDFSEGVTRFCIGLFKKVYFANIAGELGAVILEGDITKLSMAGAWYGSICFALQIYYDFSGYSDMAIGLGRMVGFHYLENFNAPYISKSIGEFWRRWHISLGSFFKDYVYLPLGGNRYHFIRNMAIVWFLTGLWHGASWNFVLWGIYNGLFIMLERKWLNKWLERLPQAVRHLYFISIMLVGWMIFYYTSIEDAFYYIGVMLGFNAISILEPSTVMSVKHNIFFLLAAIVAATPVLHILWYRMRANEIEPIKILLNTGLLMLALIYLVGQSYNPFLYFRF